MWNESTEYENISHMYPLWECDLAGSENTLTDTKSLLVSFLPESSFFLLSNPYSAARFITDLVTERWQNGSHTCWHFWTPKDFTFISENHKQHEEKYLIPGVCPWFLIKYFESQTQTQVSHFTPTVVVAISPLLTPLKGISDLDIQTHHLEPIHITLLIPVTAWDCDFTSVSKTKQWNFTFSQAPASTSASPSYGKVRDMEGRSNCLIKWDETAWASSGSWHPVRHAWYIEDTGEMKWKKWVWSSGFSTDRSWRPPASVTKWKFQWICNRWTVRLC